MPKYNSAKRMKSLVLEYQAELTEMNRRIEIISEFRQIVRKTKNITCVTNQVKGLNKSPLSTVLSIAYLSDYPALEDSILSFLTELQNGIVDKSKCYSKLNINIKLDNKGNSILHYAASSNSLRLCELLLSSFEAANLKNNEGKTPIDVTTIESVKQFFSRIGKGHEEDIYIKNGWTTLQENKRNIKKRLMNKSLNIASIQLSDNFSPSILMRNIFMEDRTHTEQVYKNLVKLYENAFFKKMIDFLALASLGQLGQSNVYKQYLHQVKEFEEMMEDDSISSEEKAILLEYINKPPKQRYFKVLCIDALSVESIAFGSHNALGVYTHKETAYVTSKEQTSKDITLCIMHESMHYVINKLFHNDSSPYRRADDTSSSTLLKQLYDFLKYYKCESKDDEIALSRFSRIISYNDYHSQVAELFVSFVEVMILLGPTQGELWLQKNMAELYTYFEENIIKALDEALKFYDADKYLKVIKEKKSPNKQVNSNVRTLVSHGLFSLETAQLAPDNYDEIEFDIKFNCTML